MARFFNNRLRSVWALLSAALVLSGLAVGSLIAEEGDTPSFGDSVDVRVINLEAVVTNGQGVRVFDLRPQDFQLLVDGKEVSIDFFTEVRDGRAAPAAIDQPQSGEIKTTAEAGKPVGNSYLVFIDDALSVGAQRNAVIDGLMENLDTLTPADRMAVIAYDGRMEMLTPWTGSKTALTSVFTAAKTRRAWGLRHIASQLNFGNNGGRAGETEPDERSRAITGVLDPTADRRSDREQINELERLSDAVANAMRGAPRTAGRKVVLLLAGGWPSDLFFDANDSYFGAPADNHLTRPITETANLLGYTLYTVGLALPSSGRIDSVAAEDVPLEGFLGSGNANENAEARGPGLRTGDPGPEVSVLENQSSLRMLAAATGGRGLFFDRRLEALPVIAADTKSYYWLGFNAPRRGDGARHKIEIKVRQAGLDVRSRSAYRDLSRAHELDLLTQSAMLYGGDGAKSALTISIGNAERAGLNRMEVPVRIGIPARELVFLPNADGVAADIELRFGAKEDNGYRTEISTIPLHLTSEAEPRPSYVFIYETTLRMRRKPHAMVVSMVDTASGQMLTQQVALAP